MAQQTDYRYTPLFCEENIWQLVRQLVDEGVAPGSLQVILISNPQREVVLFGQRGGGELGQMVWDYHVVLRRNDAIGDLIYDFDSRLPFPCDSCDYLTTTFGLQRELPAEHRAWLRLIPATSYLHRFYSDRSHMQGQVAKAAFPPWPAITPAGDGVIRLEQYWDMMSPLPDSSRLVSAAAFIDDELGCDP